MNIPRVARGSYILIRTGEAVELAELVARRPTIEEVRKAIKAPQCLDAVGLEQNRDGTYSTVMLVDDVGLLDQRPLNQTASLIARRPIYGDVVICRDEDF